MIIQGSNEPIILKMPEDMSYIDTISIILTSYGKTLKKWTRDNMLVDKITLTLPLSEDETATFNRGIAELTVKWVNAEGYVMFGNAIKINIKDYNDSTKMTDGNTPSTIAVTYMDEQTPDIVGVIDNKYISMYKGDPGYTPKKGVDYWLPEDQKELDNIKALNKEISEAESTRVENENTRVSAENSRVEAENKRVTAETERVAESREAVDNCTAIIEQARVSVEACEEITERCENATTQAETNNKKFLQFAIKNTSDKGQAITLTDSADYPLQGLTIYGKSTQDGTPTPTNPIEIVDVVNPNVTVCGKNMLNIKTCINGKAVSDKTGNEFEYQAYCTDFIPVRENANYYYSGMIRLNNGDTGAMYDKDKKYVSGIKNDTDIQPITIPQGVAYVRLNMYKDYWSNNDVSIAQLEQGTTATSYEPYITPQTQQFSCTLRGIGDIRDELTVGGQCVQRVGVVDLNDIVVWTDTSDASSSGIQNAYGFAGKCPSLKSNKAIMCNMFRTSGLVVNRVTNEIGTSYNIRVITDVADNLTDFKQWIKDNRVIIYSPLTEPIITDNTDTLTLDSYYPTTNIYSDTNAELEVEYVADTKLYVDKQILELSATMVDIATMSLLDE